MLPDLVILLSNPKSAPFSKNRPQTGEQRKYIRFPSRQPVARPLGHVGARSSPTLTWLRWALACGCVALAAQRHAQVVDASTSASKPSKMAGFGFWPTRPCSAAPDRPACRPKAQHPSDGRDNNNSHDMQYYNGDNDPDVVRVFRQLALGVCAKVSWAGLYWAGRLGGSSVPNSCATR